MQPDEQNADVKNDVVDQSVDVQDDSINPDAYKQVTNDMHKFKREAREARERAKELESKLKAIDLEKLEQSQEHQKLAEHYKTEAEELRAKYSGLSEAIVTERKMQAIEREARKAGVKNDKYLDLISQMVDEDVIVEATSTGRHNVLGADTFVEKIKAEYPDFFTDQSAPSINNSTGSYQAGKKYSGRELVQLKKQDPEAYSAYMAKLMNKR